MNVLSRLARIIYILYILLKYGLDKMVGDARGTLTARLLTLFSLSRFNGQDHHPRGQRIRKAFEELGPIFIKFGQLLSTRADIIPADILEELSKLQDQVPPFCGKIARQKVEAALMQPIETLFQQFDETPLASASIAQVHAATLLNGSQVVLKVLRPNIRQLIVRDVELLKMIAGLSHRFWKSAKPFKPKEMVAEFEKTLLDELDLLREAANASQLRRNFLDSSELYIPEVHWDLSRSTLLVTERISGIPIAHIERLKQEGFDLRQLAELGVHIFFTQVFRDCYFHADMHPGNLFISSKDPKKPQYIAVDFGMMGSLSAKDQRYIAENFLAFFKRDYRRVAELHQESGWIPSTVRIDEFEASIRLVCEPIFERPLKDISFATVLLRLFETARRFQINIQPQLLLLQKTLVNVEGLGRRLYPELDLWRSAKPFLEQWVHAQMGPEALIRKLKRYAPFWLNKLPELPELLYASLERMAFHSKEPSLTSTTGAEEAKVSKRDMILGMMLGIGVAAIFILLKGFL